MELNGTVKAFNPHKGWGFVDCNGRDIFLHKNDLKGFCPSKGDQVQFTVGETKKGAVAKNVKVVSPQVSYYGSIKSYNPSKGYGFILSEAFPDKDVFVFWAELPGGFGPEGSQCKFRVSMNEKGPAAKKVMLLGAAGRQIQHMKWMMGYSEWKHCKAGLKHVELLFKSLQGSRNGKISLVYDMMVYVGLRATASHPLICNLEHRFQHSEVFR